MRIARLYQLLSVVWAVVAGAAITLAEDTPAAWVGAHWIGDGRKDPVKVEDFYLEDPAPQFRRAFSVKGKVERASLCIAGMGYYEAKINGSRLGETALMPLWTPYGKRVLYDTHDVARFLKPGENVLAVTLGNGWYNPLPMTMWGKLNLRDNLTVGRPRLIARLVIEGADGAVETIVSDATWKHAGGPTLRNNVYLGEVYDARRETPGWDVPGLDDAAWQSAVVVEGPGGELLPRQAPPVVVRETWKASAVSKLGPDRYLADMGRNFAGHVRVRLGAGKAGDKIVFRYGELLHPDGTLNVLTSTAGQLKTPGKGGPGAPDLAEQSDTYIRRGGEAEQYAPRFTWHAFRYVEINGLGHAPGPADLEAVVVASDLENALEYECSNPLLNDIHRICRNTFLSNVVGVQSDCPARERFGYGGDIAVTADSFLMNFDMQAFYRKTLGDFADEAADDGWFTWLAPHVGTSVKGYGGLSNPFIGTRRGEGVRSGCIGWTLAVPVLMDRLYRHYGDREILAELYPACARYLDLLRGKFPDLALPHCTGDHEALEKAPTPLTAAAHFHEWARLVARFAGILNRTQDAEKYGAMADTLAASFQRRFVRAGRVGNGTQGEQVFGLYHGLIPEADRAAALEILQADIAAKGNALTTGIFGTKYLLEVLSTSGHADLAGTVVARKEFPGWGHMLENGATTLWETWKMSEDTYSHNHPMFGSVDEWLVKHVLGIAPAPEAVGFDKAVIRPNAVAGVEWARGTHRTARGPVRVDWRVAGGVMKLAAEIPEGMTAQVWLPGEKAARQAGPGRHEWKADSKQ